MEGTSGGVAVRRKRARPRGASRHGGAASGGRGNPDQSGCPSPPARKKLSPEEEEKGGGGLRPHLEPEGPLGQDWAKGAPFPNQGCPGHVGPGMSPATRLSRAYSQYDSEDDMFADYDSFCGNNSLLAEVDDIEQKYIQSADSVVDCENLGGKIAVEPACEVAQLRNATNTLHPFSVEKPITSSVRNRTECDSLRTIKDPQSSSLKYQDDIGGILKKSNECFDDPSKKADGKEKDYHVNCLDKASNLPLCHETENDDKDSKPSACASSEASRRKSLKDHIKSAMTGNARLPPPLLSKRKQPKEADASIATDVAETANDVSFVDMGPFYGLPTKVKELLLQLRGIENLYDWQHACLTLESLQKRNNLIYCLPTGGGKTLVAEILIFQELLCRQMDVLMILPYVALVQEKVGGLSGFGMELGFLVEEYAGSKGRFPPIKRRLKKSLYVATIEKGHSLVNSLIETERIHNLGLVIVDELHMLGEGSRGAVLEMTLAKLLYASKTTQIIGMSATLRNVEDLQQFLKAEYYTSNFRPVELKEYVKIQDSIYEVDSKAENGFTFSRLLDFKYSSGLKKMDPDHLIALVTEVIPKYSCLVFCPTKKNCENVAEMICKYLNREYKNLKDKEKEDLINNLTRICSGKLCPILRKTIPFGIAYHHSGLTSDERKQIEEAYSSGTLCLLACTSTLAAGVNLPARRVVLRAPYVAKEFMKKNQYKQMVGRAGRAGIDSAGESILIAQEKDRQLVQNLVQSPLESCYSNLLLEFNKGIQSLILSLVGLKIATNPEEIYRFMCGTLISLQPQLLPKEKSLWDVTVEVLQWLKQNGLLKERTARDREKNVLHNLEITPLGQATYKGSIDLAYCKTLYADLKKGLEGLILESCLHLLFLTTPYDMISQCNPDWMIYFKQFSQLSPAEQQVTAVVGVPESFITKKASGQVIKKDVDSSTVKRMYLTFVLHALLKETDVWSVAEKFNVSRGFVQTLLTSAASFSSSVLHFCEELGEFWVYKALLTELTKRLTYCVKEELIPLMEVAGVLEARAKQLYNSGYKTLTHLANADPEVLVKTIKHLSRGQARQIVSSAKMLLTEKAEALQEEVEELLRIPADLP